MSEEDWIKYPSDKKCQSINKCYSINSVIFNIKGPRKVNLQMKLLYLVALLFELALISEIQMDKFAMTLNSETDSSQPSLMAIMPS